MAPQPPRSRQSPERPESPDEAFTRERLEALKRREIDLHQQAIRFHTDAAQRWRDRGNAAMADQEEERAEMERARLTAAIAERDAWPPKASSS